MFWWGKPFISGKEVNFAAAECSFTSNRNPKKQDLRVVEVMQEIAFEAFRLDLVNECLRQDARVITLRPKAFRVLKLLVERRGQLVTKRQVLDAVWPETFVGDAVLKDVVRQLREALSDCAHNPCYIQTAHRRGYRFIAKIAPACSEAADQNPAAAAWEGESLPAAISASWSFSSWSGFLGVAATLLLIRLKNPNG
jgi:DNA-binding winged helix-turn-helix (wHTH) protein